MRTNGHSSAVEGPRTIFWFYSFKLTAEIIISLLLAGCWVCSNGERVITTGLGNQHMCRLLIRILHL